MAVIITSEKIKEIAGELDTGMLCFYHIVTGEIESYPDELKGHSGFDEELWQDIIDKVESNYGEYIRFEGMESSESFQMMESFIAHIKDKKISLDLEEAIHLRKPFQNFKNRLYDYPEVLEDWYTFKDEQIINWVQEQLTAHHLNSLSGTSEDQKSHDVN